MTKFVPVLSRKFALFFLSCLFSVTLIQAQDQHPADQEEKAHAQHDSTVHEGGHSDGAHGSEAEEFNPSEEIMHHILDSHEWHLADWPSGGEKKPIAIHFPWFFYSSGEGFVFAANEEQLIEKGYLAHHDKLYKLNPGVKPHMEEGHLHVEGDEEAWIHDHTEEGAFMLDLSPTKTVVQMLLMGILLVIVFTAVARAYGKNEGTAPKGLQSLMEPIIVFVRDDVAKEYLGKHYERFTPYLLTLFFFIWFSNLFGLTPLNSNIAGNISVTAALAIMTFIITQVNGTKDYWKHIFNMPGVPMVLKTVFPLVPLVEFIGLFTKPFALAIRLFANITAGHFMVLGLISLIFIVGENGKNTAGAFGIMPLSVMFTLIILCLEMIVAIIQAYVFTLLTAVFVGMALEEHDDHH